MIGDGKRGAGLWPQAAVPIFDSTTPSLPTSEVEVSVDEGAETKDSLIVDHCSALPADPIS